MSLFSSPLWRRVSFTHHRRFFFSAHFVFRDNRNTRAQFRYKKKKYIYTDTGGGYTLVRLPLNRQFDNFEIVLDTIFFFFGQLLDIIYKCCSFPIIM